MAYVKISDSRSMDDILDAMHAEAVRDGSPMVTWLVEVDEVRATSLLNRQGKNRPLSRPTLRLYIDELEANRWTPNSATICVNRSRQLTDGQHRMHAVVATKAVVPIQVTMDLANEMARNIDVNTHRTIRANTSITYGEDLDSRSQAIVAGLLRYQGDFVFKSKISHSKIQETRARFRDRVEFIRGLVTADSKRIVRGPVLAVLLRLSFYYPQDVVKQAANSLLTGYMSGEPWEMILIRARDMFKECGGDINMEHYWKLEYALREYCNRTGSKYLKNPGKELFPIPGFDLKIAA